MNNPRNVEILEVQFPTFDRYKFSPVTSYYLLHSPLLNFSRLSQLSWDREITNCLKNYGSLMTQILESELRTMNLTPYDWLPYFQPQIGNLQPQVHQAAPATVDYTCF